MYHIIRDIDGTDGLTELSTMLSGEYTLESFTFANNIYNVSARNNVLPYHEGVTFSELTLKEQYCDGDDIATDIASKINAVSAGTATATFDSNTQQFTITNTLPFSLKFGDKYDNMSNELLGFTTKNTAEGITSITSDITADLTPFKYIKIDINDGKGKNVVDQSYAVNTFLVQGQSNFGENFDYRAKDYTSEPQRVVLPPLRTMRIEFTDDKNKAISPTNWHLILRST